MATSVAPLQERAPRASARTSLRGKAPDRPSPVYSRSTSSCSHTPGSVASIGTCKGTCTPRLTVTSATPPPPTHATTTSRESVILKGTRMTTLSLLACAWATPTSCHHLFSCRGSLLGAVVLCGFFPSFCCCGLGLSNMLTFVCASASCCNGESVCCVCVCITYAYDYMRNSMYAAQPQQAARGCGCGRTHVL